jgi:hypothetical protein
MIVLQQRIPDTPGLHTNPTWGTGAIDYGLTDDVEIGITGLGITDFAPSYGGSFKYRFGRESRSQPALATGFTFSGFGDNNTRAGFLAARKQLNSEDARPIIGHLGVMYINVLAGLTYNQFQPYGGLEWGLAEQFRLVAEARPRGKGDLKTSTGLTLVYLYGNGNRLALTWVNTGQSTIPRFGFGVGFVIGTKR